MNKGLSDLFKNFRDLSKGKVAQKAKENPRPEKCNFKCGRQ